MRILRDLFLALLNATLVLAIILVVCMIILVRQVAGLREDTAALLAPQAERLEQISRTAEMIETRISSGNSADLVAGCSELAGLRTLMPEPSDLDKLTARSLAEEIVNVVGERLRFRDSR